MTVQELIAALNALPKECQDMQVRLEVTTSGECGGDILVEDDASTVSIENNRVFIS